MRKLNRLIATVALLACLSSCRHSPTATMAPPSLSPVATTSQDAAADIGSVHSTIDDTIIRMKRSADVGLIKAPNLFTDVLFQLGRQQTANQHLLDVEKHVASIQARSQSVEAEYQGVIAMKDEGLRRKTIQVDKDAVVIADQKTKLAAYHDQWIGDRTWRWLWRIVGAWFAIEVGSVLLVAWNPLGIGRRVGTWLLQAMPVSNVFHWIAGRL